MADMRSSSPFDCRFNRVAIKSNRFGDYEFNITNNVIQFDITEDIDMLTLTAHLVILDNDNLLEVIDFQGQEFVVVDIAKPEAGLPPIRRIFNIIGVESVTRGTNDQNEVFTLNLIDRNAFQSELTNINKKYDGNPLAIIRSILNDAFAGVPEPRSFVTTEAQTFQQNMRVIIPNWDPYTAIRWMSNRSTSNTGAPFYCWSVWRDDDLRFFDLETMLQRPAINAGMPYKFNQSLTANAAQYTVQSQGYFILDFLLPPQERIVPLLRQGDIGGHYSFLDTQNFADNAFQFSIKKVFDNMNKNTTLTEKRRSPTYDDQFVMGDKYLHEYTSKKIMQIGTTSIYNDIPGYYEDVTPAHHSTKAISKALRDFTFKTPLMLKVPGRNFLPLPGDQYANTGIGNVIEVEFIDNEPIVKGKDYSKHVDKKRSGNYLIKSIKHVVQREGVKAQHVCYLNCIKLTNREGAT
tara:strand:- start:2026 stop:3411 length:1386 start_codon:yes stop_codon:yes gene_type:complete